MEAKVQQPRNGLLSNVTKRLFRAANSGTTLCLGIRACSDFSKGQSAE